MSYYKATNTFNFNLQKRYNRDRQDGQLWSDEAGRPTKAAAGLWKCGGLFRKSRSSADGSVGQPTGLEVPGHGVDAADKVWLHPDKNRSAQVDIPLTFTNPW